MRILFVCTGNTCRSPMAEGLLRQMAEQEQMQLDVRSAGVAAAEGIQISYHAEGVLRDHHIKDQITSSPIRMDTVEWADLILTLTEGHKRQVLQHFPNGAGKTYTLKEYVEDDIQVLQDIAELDSLLASKALQNSLGQSLTPSEGERMIELRQRIPVYDISDPYGGSREEYDRTAAEIRTALDKLMDKLKNGRGM
ncbi:protein-tyrosine phosphatase [Paenibacillus shirakamiensis]|uniref:Protein-tyrosine phosphatase n=1 Tax=Paenibacillus shirakamiensis TaxID=1265935 RepID=A0ABS4JJG4_9BACL|nr:protein-tyrosine phosphatase [Paenibacillus shirakamiensis]